MNRPNSYTNIDAEEEIVISGIAGRFPNSDNLKKFQENLLNKVDLSTTEHGRWNNSYNMPHRIGMVSNIEKFDRQFFNVSATEAHVMDPMARMFYEHTYEAIVDAGFNPKDLRGTKTSVLTAISCSETRSFFLYHPQMAEISMIGTSLSVIANRISYWLGVTGPSYNIDTACSSSSFAIVKAFEMIRSGNCDAAIIASANLCFHPYIQFQFYHLGVLSSDGYCKPYDEEGTGYMRSDTVAVVYLQKAKDARRIYASFIHGKINCDGFKGEGITFPSLEKQTLLLKEFYEECQISPNELSYMEAHTTGTLAGDPVEVMSIDQALCSQRNTPLMIGSVKSNLGHSEAASGFCQIAKVLLAMETGIITPTIHYKRPRKQLTAIIEGRIKIVTEPTEWKGGYICVNSFGFGGANAHILLKSNPKLKINNGIPNDDLPRLVAVSGCTEEAVKILLDDVQNRLVDAEYISLLHHIYNDNIEGHHYRGYIITGSKSHYTINKIEHLSYIRRPICFIFSGLGSQWFGMGRAVLKFSVFAEAIQKCDSVLKPHGILLTDILTSDNKNIFDNIINLLLGVVGLQIGVIDLLTSIGIAPDFIIGHSIGELVCGYADGCLTAEETILSAYFIGLALHESKIINGSMAEINLDLETLKNVCPTDIDIACYNRSTNFIVSGPTSSMKAFLAKLKANNISVKEIFCGSVPLHSRYVEPAALKCKEYLNQVLSQKKFYSLKLLSTSAYEYANTPLCSKYYVNYLLSPVIFAKTIRSIPTNAVTIEISSHNILQHIMKESLDSTVTNIALPQNAEDPNGEIFLDSIGKLYNAGLQPQIANLYTAVEFPVSRGTPMISSLVRWDHSEKMFVMRFRERKIVDKREIDFTFNTKDEEFVYLTGHVVNEKNLFPAMGYLFYVWDIIASLGNQDYDNTPIVFEDVNFIRATVLSQQNDVVLTFSIQEGSNRFEITEGGSAVVTGKVRFPINVENEKISANLAHCIEDKEEMTTKDIYKELRLRGYNYTGVFRGLKSASVTGSKGHIAWANNWVAFMDSMLQMMILGQYSRSLLVPTRIRKLTIDPKYHIQLIHDYPIEEREFPVYHYNSLDATISGGIEICGIIATPIFRRQKTVNTVLEEYKFVAHRDLETMSLQDAMRMSIHIALECSNMINVKIIEFADDSDKVTLKDLNAPLVSEILNDLPQIRHHTRIVTTRERFPNISLPNDVCTTEINKLSKDENCLMIIGFDILTKNNKKLYEQLLPFLMQQGFLLTLEKSSLMNDYSCLKTYDLDVILEKQIKEKKLVLLRKLQNVSKIHYHIVHVHNYDFSWVDELKSVMKMQSETNANRTCTVRIILVAKEFECGLLGLINCLRKELGGEMIRSVFIQDNKAPAFSLEETLYIKQLQLDLPINVLRSGNIWGSYRHFPLPTLEPKLVEIANVKQTVEGDLSTLRWEENRMSSYIKREDLVNVIYSPLNFKDIMLATGRLQTSAIYCNLNDLLGFEFAGIDYKGRRVMGICSHGGITNICAADKYLTWVVPNKWTMEDAATVPCVYTTCYVALYMKGKMKKSDKILIHSGTGGVGQAAIHLALYEGCEVFTTVGTAEKRQFIRKTFPSIPEDNIGNSRDTSFEQMIMQRTEGRGVDIVLNSLAEEKLQASVRCLSNGGRFLEIGKFDIISNNPLNLYIFSKGITFHGILLDKLYSTYTEEKIMLSERIAEGLENGAIKPLCTEVFERIEIESAFRYMATGKHIGKVIIKVREENESLDSPLPAYPRYYCSEHKCYIILGGLGGFGLELANWLILRGAKNVVLTSRNGIKTGYQLSKIKLWQSYGVNVQIFTVDDTLKHEDCENILKLAEEMAPVDAIFNLAVVLKDCIFQNQSAQTFEDSFKSKAWMTKKMDELSRKICLQLRHFVVFSSVSCGRGNAGQTNYGMANSVMERICERRMEEGLHGLAIQWGAVGDVGLVADMQEENKELVIGGTLQQRLSSCLNTLEMFLLQERPVVSSMVVAEKAKVGGSMNIYETVAHIMGLKNISAVPPNISLAEMGMDSMMAVEIKQTLEREFDISMTAQDIRTLNFAKLKQMTMTVEQGKLYDTNEINASNLDGFKALIRKTKDSDFVPNILVELVTKKEFDKGNVFLLPGIEGCFSVYKSIAPGIKFSATCLQHGVLNIPDESHSVVKSAAYLLPHILKKMKNQKKFLIVGYSFGTLIAIELARLLEANGFSGRLILIDGAPDLLKYWINQYMDYTLPEELQDVILLGLLNIYTSINKKTLALELKKRVTLEEKLKFFHAHFPKNLNILTIENQKLVYFTIYNHIIAIQDYNVSSLPRLKSPITLLKSTFPIVSFPEEDYGLHKVTENKVQIRYVEGNHITMMENDKIISIINEEWIQDNEKII